MGFSVFAVQKSRVILVLLAMVLIGMAGCLGKPPRLKAPKWEPEVMTNQAIDFADKDGDRVLDPNELSALPGLKASIKPIDTNNDGKIQESELMARLQLYKESKTAYRPKKVVVTFKGKPLAGATVKAIPEPFVAGLVEPAEGITDSLGTVSLNCGQMKMALMRIGYYTLQITSDTIKLPEKFNTKSILGIEVSPISDGDNAQDIPFFDLE